MLWFEKDQIKNFIPWLGVGAVFCIEIYGIGNQILSSNQNKNIQESESTKEIIRKCPYIEGPLKTPYTKKFRDNHFRKFHMIFPQLCQGLIQLNKKLVLLGITGVGKTQLFQKCTGQSQPSGSTTKVEIGARRWDCMIADTPPFNIDSEVEQREQFIGQMQLFFVQNKFQIGGLIMVVNFERTDLMKKKLTDVFKYIRRFADHNISIIITDWHLSEQKEQDEQTLRNAFRLYRPRYIHFVSNDIIQEDLNNILDEIQGIQGKRQSIISNGSQSTIEEEVRVCRELNLQDSIFEIQEDNPEFMEKLNQLAIAVSRQR